MFMLKSEYTELDLAYVHTREFNLYIQGFIQRGGSPGIPPPPLKILKINNVLPNSSYGVLQ